MMNERQIENLLHDPRIKGAGRSLRPVPLGTDHASDSAERALAIWIAVLTQHFLRSIHAVSNPLVEKVWTFARGKADIDMRVGVHGAYRKFKVETSVTGPQTFKLQIRAWHKALVGFHVKDLEDVWTRYGVYRGEGDYEGIETLPIR